MKIAQLEDQPFPPGAQISLYRAFINAGKAQIRDPQGSPRGKVVGPSQRKEMARHLVDEKSVSIRFACETFGISETCYRYGARLGDENAEIADWLLRLTQTYKRWGFGLCFLYLRNTKGYRWNHKRVYRICRELELNLRIKTKRRIKRDRPDELSVPVAI